MKERKIKKDKTSINPENDSIKSIWSKPLIHMISQKKTLEGGGTQADAFDTGVTATS